MIRNTFQLIPGVGPSRERDLWGQGIRHWDHFPGDGGEIALSKRQDPGAREHLNRARQSLAAGDLGALAQALPQREHWRLYREFSEQAVFFDIETDGRQAMAPTAVSLFHARGFEVFLQGRNLDELPQALARFPMWVSFNGSVFDVPVLQAHFGELPRPALHLDLRFVCRRLGMRGGLKHLEEALGFGRPPHLKGVGGMDAVLLWRAWRDGKELAALRFLVEYNLYDSIQLRTLADRAFNHAAQSLGFAEHSMPVFERGDVLYDISRYLLSLGPGGGEAELIERLRTEIAP